MPGLHSSSHRLRRVLPGLPAYRRLTKNSKPDNRSYNNSNVLCPMPAARSEQFASSASATRHRRASGCTFTASPCSLLASKQLCTYCHAAASAAAGVQATAGKLLAVYADTKWLAAATSAAAGGVAATDTTATTAVAAANITTASMAATCSTASGSSMCHSSSSIALSPSALPSA